MKCFLPFGHSVTQCTPRVEKVSQRASPNSPPRISWASSSSSGSRKGMSRTDYRGVEAAEEGGGRDGRLERAKLDAFGHLALLAELALRVDLERSRRHRCARQPVRRPWRYGRGATADRIPDGRSWPRIPVPTRWTRKDMAIREAPTAVPSFERILFIVPPPVAGPKSPKAGSKRNDMFLSTEFLKNETNLGIAMAIWDGSGD